MFSLHVQYIIENICSKMEACRKKVYVTRDKTFTHLQATAGNLCSLVIIYVTRAAIKSKMNYNILHRL